MRLFRCLCAVFLLAPAATHAKPATEQAAPAADEDIVAQLRAAVAAMREEMFRPGPPVPGWNVGGADPDAALRAAGAERNYYLLTATGEPPEVIILTQRPLADFAPAAWRIVDSYGSAGDPVAHPFIQFSWVSPRYVVGMRVNGVRRDNVDCSDTVGHALLYELPGDAMTEEDESAGMMFRLGLMASEGITTCTRYEGSREAGWTTRALLPDGRSLPALDRPGERLTIVPAAPVDRLMRR